MEKYKDYGWKDNKPPLTHGWLMPELLKWLDKKTTLNLMDLGCGNGAMAIELSKEGYTVYGVDASREGIDIANQTLPGHFFYMDFSEDYEDDIFKELNINAIISMDVIEHLYSPQKYVQLINALLPEGGVLIISTPYNGWLKNIVLSITNQMDRHWSVLWEGGHIKFFSRKTLTEILEKNGFKVLKFKGLGRLPFLWKSMMIYAVKEK